MSAKERGNVDDVAVDGHPGGGERLIVQGKFKWRNFAEPNREREVVKDIEHDLWKSQVVWCRPTTLKKTTTAAAAAAARLT
jgi:hypothetical protein